jgi:rhamnosyltransferase
MKNVFIIGSKGIPAKYGGFETFVEKLTEYKKRDDVFYHISCMANDKKEFKYNNARCFNINVPQIGSAKAVYYDLLSLKACINYIKRNSIKSPIIYVLACRIGPFIKHYKKQIKSLGGYLIINPDGHEFLRAKWSLAVRKYWKYSEMLMAKHAELLVCDSKKIMKYIKRDYRQYNPETTFIAYGAETRKSLLTDDDPKLKNWYAKTKINPNEYYLIIGRFVPENNYETILKEFMASDTLKKLVLITDVQNNKFFIKLKEETKFNEDRVKFAGTVYDSELIKKIRENAFAYIHGHEIGGTNPSLLESLGSTELNLLLNVDFNSEVAENAAIYWSKEKGSLSSVINRADVMSKEEIREMGIRAKNRITSFYSWDYIVNEYEKLFVDINNFIR